MSLSPNTQATLLLTAPLIAGREDATADPLTPREYLQLTRLLTKLDLQPSALLVTEPEDLPSEVGTLIDERVRTLLARGFQLSQALEHWQSRAIWVVGHLDEAYPKRLTERLKEHTPPIIYGCGDASIVEMGGLAVVGSRDVDSELIEFTEAVGRLAALAERTLVSGGARGIDQASMRGALEAGGRALGVLADSLERAAMKREHRELLMDSRLLVISAYDPSVGFNVGFAMQRNKLIYALADAALVVNSDYEKGGTWAGAVEQLEKLHFVPVYVRQGGESAKGLEALLRKGGIAWPNPTSPEQLIDVIENVSIPSHERAPEQLSLL
jgi:predicted Rossmann fold nucleotide-binding protein DprA/Smf involved in DNA uptake